MSLQLYSAAAIDPLSVEDAKAHLRVDTDDATETGLIASLISAATAWIENVTWRQLIAATYILRMRSWPGGEIVVPRPKLLTVTGITYVDTAGATQTWAASEYVVDIHSVPGRIYPAYGESFPTHRGYENDLAITYTAGYGSAAANVPKDLVHAIKLMVGHFYWHREAVTSMPLKQAPLAVQHLIAPYRVKDNRILEYV